MCFAMRCTRGIVQTVIVQEKVRLDQLYCMKTMYSTLGCLD